VGKQGKAGTFSMNYEPGGMSVQSTVLGRQGLQIEGRRYSGSHMAELDSTGATSGTKMRAVNSKPRGKLS
jgi:hypothetical protein